MWQNMQLFLILSRENSKETKKIVTFRAVKLKHNIPNQTTEKSKVILVVEDDDTIRELVQLTLMEEEHNAVLCAAHGYEALELVRTTTPDVFLLDYQLPSMTGIQLYDKLHAMQGFQHIPGIIMSANLPLSELERRDLLGLYKPFDLDELLLIVQEALEISSREEW
jgi:CheY-like chemotaxis protein